jgi:hypothetical protein
MASGDKVAQHAAITVTESAANTLTFQQLQTGAALFERRALMIHRIEYIPSMATVNLLLDSSDLIIMGLSTSSSITDLEPSNPNIFDQLQIGMIDIGTVANMQLLFHPIVHDFAMLPGGGLLLPGYPVYGFVKGTSIASACIVRFRFQFTAIQLKPEEYIELVEASRIIT